MRRRRSSTSSRSAEPAVARPPPRGALRRAGVSIVSGEPEPARRERLTGLVRRFKEGKMIAFKLSWLSFSVKSAWAPKPRRRRPTLAFLAWALIVLPSFSPEDIERHHKVFVGVTNHHDRIGLYEYDVPTRKLRLLGFIGEMANLRSEEWQGRSTRISSKAPTATCTSRPMEAKTVRNT